MTKRMEITERINGTCKYLYCVYCRNIMFPKQLLFKTTKSDGGMIFNYLGKDGFSCFVQHGTYTFCKKCANLCKDDLPYIINHLNKSSPPKKPEKTLTECITDRIDVDLDDTTFH